MITENQLWKIIHTGTSFRFRKLFGNIANLPHCQVQRLSIPPEEL